MFTNNATSIIRNWKSKWYQTKAHYYMKAIFDATGELPDYSSSNFLGGNEPEGTEDSLIEERIKNNITIY